MEKEQHDGRGRDVDLFSGLYKAISASGTVEVAVTLQKFVERNIFIHFYKIIFSKR